MKILECGEGERLVIDNDIILTIVKVTEDEVSIAIESREDPKVRCQEHLDYAI